MVVLIKMHAKAFRKVENANVSLCEGFSHAATHHTFPEQNHLLT